MLAAPALAQTPNYLNNQALFSKGWSELIEKVGSAADVTEVAIRPDAIDILARAQGGGARIDRWSVGFSTIMSITFHRVSGPRPERPSTPVRDIEGGFFRLASVPIRRFWPILEAALARVRLDEPGRIASVRIAKAVTILPEPAFGDVRWTIGVANDRENASVTADADGRIMGADIAGTNRGRNRNFLEQDEWPLADAQASFRTVIGARREVYEVSVSRTSIAMKAVAANNASATTSWLWDGGSFRRDFIDAPNVDLMRHNGNLPFSLDEVDIARFPAILKVAREREPGGRPRIMIARAIKERVAVGEPRVLWEIQMVDAHRQIPLIGEDFSERTVVKLTPDGTVVSVLLPRSLRPKIDGLSPDGVLAALDTFRTAYGPAMKVLNLSFGQERAEITMLPNGDAGPPVEVALLDRGLVESSMSPMPTSRRRVTFTLDDLARLDKPLLEAMLARAQQGVPIAGARVHRIRIWSGEPFWRPRQGLPYVDIRVGVPPRFDAGGYVVFTADGKFIEAVR
jgi:hypothetical protein